MEISKGKTYFDKENIKKQYPYLNNDAKCDVLIIGGGIDGAIVNYHMSKKYKTILVDKGRFGLGNTVAATALLEYQLDDFAEDLKSYLSEKEIEKIYKLGQKSIKEIEKIDKKYKANFDFKLKPSLIYTDSKKDVEDFEKEYRFRKKCGLKCKYIDSNNNPFSFDLEAGLFCEDGGAEFNPYLFTHILLNKSKGLKFENTEVVSIENNGQNLVCLTNYGYKIFCNKVVCATGFNDNLVSQKPLSEKFVSYTIVTNPIKNLVWEGDALIQDYMSPYHYLRKLPDGRIIFGGEDTPYKGIIKNEDAEEKYKQLYNMLIKMFPAFNDEIKVEYAFCGFFASTLNNMGIISKTNQENVHIFSSCGANGIINAFFGVKLLNDLFENKYNWLEKIFSLKRKVY